ncbi:alpha/beta fold hydrolase [Glutamicibacter arilaitensis]|uniref:alpha/beta fold hydrolase n=1 Tax=Glutamicibacter arilaitensis TaxID=256701 RepID=UPI003FD3FD93
MSTVEVNGVVFGINSFGSEEDPLVLLIGGTTMLSWPDSFCEALAAGGRRAVRYDLRDSGDSTAGNPMKPAYDLRDLAADAAALAAHLDDRPAHLAGIGVSGMVAQVAALDHPGSFDALTLVGTRPVAPGPVDDDLPDHDQATMGKLFSRPMPDWMDREAVARHSAEGSQILGNDHQTAKVLAGRIWDRTAGSTPEMHMANQIGIVFSKLDCTPRWRERLPELEMPTLVIHGAKDPFFPVGNGEALVREIPNASLLVLENASTVIPPSDFGEVAAAMLQL